MVIKKGQRLSPATEYKKGMVSPNKGKIGIYHHTPEQRAKCGNSGEKHPLFGKKRTEEERKNIAAGNKGKQAGAKNPIYKIPPEKEALESYFQNHSLMETADFFKASRQLTSKWFKKYGIPIIRKPKLSKTRSGSISKALIGMPKSETHKQNISIGRIGKYTGKDCPAWIDGRSFLPYCPKFNEELKRRVRDRDNHTCQLCGKSEKENWRRLDCHHVHYDKENCQPDLIALCWLCNVQVNHNRNYYESLFMNILNDRCLLFWTAKK